MSFQKFQKRMHSQGSRIGEVHKRNSDLIMNQTWDNDIQSKKCYIYDYYHDAEGEKTPIDAKFIVTQYGSLSKDQVEYHIMFRPTSPCPLDYYKGKQSDTYNAEYPIGLYIDIPDANGVYRKWLICSSDNEQQFVKHSILPCNYEFKWILDGKKYSMWGVARLRNSYNSGLWTDYMTTVVENQDQMWLPMNEISAKLYQGDRIIISALIEKPITWEISKVENIHPFGLNKLTLAQDKFNPEKDYVNFETGEMYADYYKSAITPEVPKTSLPYPAEIKMVGKVNSLKVPGVIKKLYVDFVEQYSGTYEWKIYCDGKNVFDQFNVVYLNKTSNKKIQIHSDNFEFVGKVLEIYVVDNSGKTLCKTLKLEVVSL